MSARAADNPKWALVRNVVVLQIKLLVDGLRDLVLAPAAIIAAVASLLSSKDGQPGSQFNTVLKLGRQSEEWIDLFAAANEQADTESDESDATVAELDKLLTRVESYLVDEYQSGNVSAQARAQLERALSRLRRRDRDSR